MTLSHTGILIRQATLADARGILDCLAAAFEPYRASYTPEAYLDTVLTDATILARLASMHIFVAIAGETQVVGTIGCALISPEEGHLRGMALLADHAGSGLAERLLSAAEADLAAQGCSRITLDTTEPLQRAIRFYEKRGYHRSGRVADFFGMRLHEYVKDIDAVRK